MKRFEEIISGFVFLIISIFLLIGTNSITIIPRSKISSAVFPAIIGWVMAGLSVVLIVLEIKKLVTEQAAPGAEVQQDDKQVSAEGRMAVLTTFALIACYVFFLDKLGFIITTALYLIGQILLLATKKQRKRWYLIIPFSIVIAVVIYYVFYYGFSLLLPAGLLG